MMQNEDSKSPDPDSEDQFERFEQVLKRVIAVPKTEIDAARKAEKQKPPRKTA